MTALRQLCDKWTAVASVALTLPLAAPAGFIVIGEKRLVRVDGEIERAPFRLLPQGRARHGGGTGKSPAFHRIVLTMSSCQSPQVRVLY